MSLHSSQFYNFNQMLVISVFVHCLMLTLVLFMPKSEWVQEKIRPVFTVDLVEVPAIPGSQPGDLPEEGQQQKAVSPSQESAVETPVTQKPLTKKTSGTKEAPNPVPQPKSKFTSGDKSVKLEDLPFTGTPTPKTKPGQSLSTLEELEQMAKLPPTVKQPTNKKSSPTLLEDSLRELDALKTPAESPGEKKKPGPSRVTEALKGFDTLQMEKHVPIEMPKPNPVPRKEDLSLEELEFAMLAKRKIQSGTPDTTVADRRELLEKLEELQELKKSSKPVVIQKKTSTQEFETLIVQQMESTQQVLDKIASLDKQHEVEVSFDLGESTRSQPVKFKSRIWAVKSDTLGKGVKGKATGAGSKQTFVYQGPVGQAQAADPLSQYVGRVHQQIYRNWRNPLGAGHNEVKVSFYIYRAGNIDQPELVASSGDSQLDKLALMAIKDSAPFPKFPSALKEPNLHITINFKYIAKK
ncbi:MULTISPECIES: energy transducer TonB [unclassified Nitrospina]|uniref:energy transducer TonB n=1 Tax=unclassified Nitrospina TaxID=2638683 RepID=UPI003F946445